MYRPGGFPEYTPSDQKKFDIIMDITRWVFEKHNFEHIWTPAVEPVEILKKWWDVVDKQVYGLFGLAQWVEDVKDYALHFDLTIPLARYVLDNRNELVFPFRRYQIQPVWRWERTKRGRYKEFWQFDVDVIRPSESNITTRYDIETVFVIDQAIQEILKQTKVDINYKLHISDIVLTKNRLISRSIKEEDISKILNILDDYYKVDRDIFEDKLSHLMDPQSLTLLCEIIDAQDPNHPSLVSVEWHDRFMDIIWWLEKLWVNYSYDINIVRWHGYYKGMVCERFDEDDISLGSLAWWWRYDNLTDFIDKKQSYSGVWASLWRLIPAVIEKMDDTTWGDKFLFINFQETREDILKLYKKFVSEDQICELYPTSAKLGKQFEYADKKGIRYCVILWDSELENSNYKIKDLQTWEEDVCKLEISVK